MLIELVVFAVTAVVAYLFYTHKKLQNNFDQHGVKYLPGIPVFGNIYKSSFQKRHVMDDVMEVYNAFPDEKYVGYMESTLPIIMIRDPELIRAVTVKDFDHFVDHRQFFPEEIDTMFGGSVFAMRGEKWRDMRTTLSPAFTGAKMRHMMPFMAEISDNIMAYLKDNRGPDGVVDIGDVMRRYTNDVIASAGFGLQVNSVKEKDNQFYVLGQNLFSFTVWQRIYMFLFTLFPAMTRLRIQLFPKKIRDFFNDIVSSTIEYRRKHHVERPDMIQLLMEATTGNLKANEGENDKEIGFATVDEALKPNTTNRKWTKEEITSQVFIFFAAGFESSSSALIMCAHELAINPEVQETLYQELKEFKQAKGNLTYDNISELKYLDAVFNETFRKWSAAIVLDRLVTQTYELPPPHPGGKPYRLNPGDIVYNSVNAIHMDPQYYPNPHKFDPTRFDDAHKHNIQPFTFMPFGSGPRNCIGSRFAILELKVLLYHMVLTFKLVKSAQTLDPIVLDNKDFNIRVKGGSWIKLEPRT